MRIKVIIETSSAGVWPGLRFKSGSCRIFPVCTLMTRTMFAEDEVEFRKQSELR